ncbi:LOB domain-containing protein 16-like [Apium graveolens]|uniref:LOB domain-containing protein 16-like n=1 Tax=Apium graveolens TaxID=4045 RepID=UPI003D7B0498
MATATGTSSPCGACKFLRRKCATDCIFAPYFCSDQGPARFAAIHKVFGASNVSKLLLHIPVADRCEAVVTIAYEAQARIRDPVYGCVAHIFALQQQVVYLQAQLMQVKSQMAQSLIDSRNAELQWSGNMCMGGNGMQTTLPPAYNNNSSHNIAKNEYINSVSPQSSLESADYGNEGMSMQEIQSKDDQLMLFIQNAMQRPPDSFSQAEYGDLQSLAHRMMRN